MGENLGILWRMFRFVLGVDAEVGGTKEGEENVSECVSQTKNSNIMISLSQILTLYPISFSLCTARCCLEGGAL